MKIRSGFVSNSSSSSFLIYGIQMDSDELLEALGITEDDQEDPDFEEYEVIEQKVEDAGLFFCAPFYGDNGYYIGLSWDSIGDDETGKEFKQDVFNKIKSILPDVEESDLGSLEEAWHD